MSLEKSENFFEWSFKELVLQSSLASLISLLRSSYV